MADPSQPTARPLLVTGDDELVDELVFLADSLDVDLTVVDDAGSARRWWASAPLVLVGDDCAEDLARECLPPRGRVIVIGRDDDVAVFERAAQVGASHVEFLPNGEEWLSEQILDSVAPRMGTVVIAVVGGRGGAGASTLAAALSFAGLRRGMATLLVDADPLGSGMGQLRAAAGAGGHDGSVLGPGRPARHRAGDHGVRPSSRRLGSRSGRR